VVPTHLSCLDCFLSGGELCRFEYAVSCAQFLAQARGGTCTIASSDATEDVLHRAFYLLENGFGPYNVFKNNCEDFAIYCKTGLLVTTKISLGGSGQAGSCSAAASFHSFFISSICDHKFLWHDIWLVVEHIALED
jgi:hypothetical protein